MINLNRSTKFNTIEGGYLSDALTQRYTERTHRIFNDSDQLVQLAQKWKNVAADKAQGHTFEQLEVIKFNSDALAKDSDLFSKTTASMGLPHDKVDIVIKRGQKVVREVQAKSCGNAARSTFAQSNPEYKEMLRLSPSDQTDKIKELLRKRIDSGTPKAKDYEQAFRNIAKRLKHENVSSTGTTYQEALDSTDVSVAEKLSSEFKLKSALTDMHESGKHAGNIGALITGGSSAVTNIYSLYKGEIGVGEVISRVATDSAQGYAIGYVTTAMSKGITHTATCYFAKPVASALTRSNAPVAIASGIISTSKSLISYLNGEINDEELVEEISHTAIASTSSFYYGVLGQTVIPIPVVGAMVGAGIGYFVGNILHQSGLIALGDSKIVKEAKERRRTVQAMCLAATSEIRKNRLELENHLESHFKKRKNEFLTSFNMLDKALYNLDPDNFISGLERINNQFGASLQFKSFTEFDNFMHSDEAFEF